MKIVRLVLSLLLLSASICVCAEVIASARQNQARKVDYAELNSVKYGLFSIDAWKGQLVAVVTGEIDKLYLSDETEKQLREHIEIILNKMIDEAAAKIEKANKETTTGKIKQYFIDAFVDIKDVKKGIPDYTNAVIAEMKRPETKRQLESVVDSQLADYVAKTNDPQDRSHLNAIIAAAGAKDVAGARLQLDEAIAKTQLLVEELSVAQIALALVIFVMFLTAERDAPVQFVIIIATLLTLLAAGVATPMIDMEAKIARLQFSLIGYPILFENQVLYFQSKSILDVFWLMITDGQLQMKLVGVLVVSFSLVFPILKLLAMIPYFYGFKRARQWPIVVWFVHKSGKWSMADVMVVAIFMAYIGFNGVINSQLKDVNITSTDVNVITTNGTNLQPGYFVFLAFVLISILVSGLLKLRRSNRAFFASSPSNLPD
jgi:hypothetical protein